MGVRVGVAVGAGPGVATGIGVGVGEGDAVGFWMLVGLGFGGGIVVGVEVAVCSGMGVGVGVRVDLGTGVAVGINVDVWCGETITVGVGVGAKVGSCGASPVDAGEVGIAVSSGKAASSPPQATNSNTPMATARRTTVRKSLSLLSLEPQEITTTMPFPHMNAENLAESLKEPLKN